MKKQLNRESIDIIEVGDTVSIRYNDTDWISEAVVLKVPDGPRGRWELKRCDNKGIEYTHNFQRMVLISKMPK